MADARPTFWIRREGESTVAGSLYWHWILEDADGHVVTEEARRHRSVASCRAAIESRLRAVAFGAAVEAENDWDADILAGLFDPAC